MIKLVFILLLLLGCAGPPDVPDPAENPPELNGKIIGEEELKEIIE